jgi:serine/threonine-protein kinase
MFENEAHLATRFQHKNVVETYDIYSARDLCVLVMEFLDGQTLSRIRQRAKKGSCVPFAVHLRVLAEALAGLHYVHELADDQRRPLGIVHRDVTPSNIFVSYDGRVKVVDFGIAKATIRETETRIGVVKGKLGYMSPEAVRNEYLDRRSDIFSVGVMLWEAATGRRLWHDHDELAVFRRLTAGDLPIQMPDVHGTGAEMLRIAQRALAVDPSRRYATADEMRDELEDVMSELGKTTQLASLGSYMETFFAVERQKFQKVVDTALARFPSRPVPQSQLLRNEVSASYPGVDESEAPTRISSPPTSGGTFRPATLSYDLPVEAGETPNVRPKIRRGFGVAVLAGAAALGIAYAANVPVDASARAAGAPVTGQRSAVPAYDEAPASVNRSDREPPVVPQAPPVIPVATQLAMTPVMSGAPPAVPAPVLAPVPTDVPAPAPARGTISAVFVVHPLHARLFLDGALLEGNPAGIRRPADDKPHLLRAEAPGYAPLVRIVDFDRDVAKEFDLAPGTALSTEPHDEAARPRPAQRPHGRDDPWGI